MSHSLNETEGLVRKAAMGAGWPVGLAQELGRAAARSCANGQNGAKLALICLQDEGVDVFTAQVHFFDQIQPNESKDAIAQETAIVEGLAAVLGQDRDGIFEHSDEGWCLKTGHKPSAEKPCRASISAGDLAALNALAAKTYVPATAASRTGGAGAGLTDND